MLIYLCREREREHSRERERERERPRERDCDGDRDRNREYRREARESSGAVNDSTSMRPKDVCLFLSIYYLAKLCTISSTVNLRATASAVERSAPLNRKKNAFCAVHSDIYQARNAQRASVANVLSGTGKADVLSCSGSHKQRLLAPVVWRRYHIVPLPARSVLPIAFLWPLRFGLQDGSYINGRNTSVYMYLSRFCFALAWDCSQDLFILFGKFFIFFAFFF